MKLPLFLSANATNLIIALLNRNPQKRLGAGKEDANAIKKHPWFAEIDWELAKARKLKVPPPKIRPLPEGYISPDIFGDRSNENVVKGWEYVKKRDKNIPSV